MRCNVPTLGKVTPHGKPDAHIDFRGQEWVTMYPTCCDRQVVRIDPLGHGSVANTDAGGNVTHQAWIAGALTHMSYHNPDSAIHSEAYHDRGV